MDIQDLVTQAVNPNEASDGGSVRADHVVPTDFKNKPQFYEETNGYLPPKSFRNSGKKTLVSRIKRN